MALIKLNSRAIPDSTVVNTDIADGSVTQAKVADGSISSTKIADDAVTGSKIGIETGRRNIFINGNFRIAQRGTSATYTGGIWQYLSPDRWMGHFDSSPTGATHHVFDGGPYAAAANNKFAEVRGPTSANSGNGNGYFGQRVESSSLAGIRAKNSFTISGWIKRSGSVNAAVSTNIICPTATDNFAGYTTHGAAFNSATISGDGTVNNNGTLTLTSVDTWYYFTVTRTSATSLTNFDKGLQIYWAFGNCNNTADKLQFAQLQLEEGTEATTFEHSTYAAELYLCQRYHFRITGNENNNASDGGFAMTTNWDTNTFFTTLDFPVQMRAAPSFSYGAALSDFLILSTTTTAEPTGISLNGASKQRCEMNFQKSGGFGTAGYSGWLRIVDNTNGFIAFDSEL